MKELEREVGSDEEADEASATDDSLSHCSSAPAPSPSPPGDGMHTQMSDSQTSEGGEATAADEPPPTPKTTTSGKDIVERVVYNCEAHDSCGGGICVEVAVRCPLCNKKSTKTFSPKQIVPHIRKDHKALSPMKVRKGADALGLNAYSCGFPYLEQYAIAAHLEKDCLEREVCGQTGNGLKGALLAAAPCGKEDCPCQSNNFEADKENDVAVFYCPVPSCLSHATKAFKKPRDLLQHVSSVHRDVPLKGLPWSDAGLAQCGCGLLHLQGKNVIHSCSGDVTGTQWVAGNAPLQVIKDVKWDEVYTHRRAPPAWVYGSQKIMAAFLPIYSATLAQVAAHVNNESWWKLIFLLPSLLLRAASNANTRDVTEIVQRCAVLRENSSQEWKRLRQSWRLAPSPPIGTDDPVTSNSGNENADDDGDDDGFARLAARVHQLGAHGEISKAFSVLTSNGVFRPIRTQQDVEKVQQLFPDPKPGPPIAPAPQGAALSAGNGDGQPQADRSESEEQLRNTISRLARGRAAGATGCRAELFLALAGSLVQRRKGVSTSIRSLTVVVDSLIKGLAPEPIYRYLAGGHLVTLAKKNDGIRPIVLQPILYKIAAKTVWKAVEGAVPGALGPNQHGVGVKGGAEIMVHKVRFALEKLDNAVMVQLDLKNGFGMVDRAAAIAAIEREGPTLAPLANFVRTFYGKGLTLSGDLAPGDDTTDDIYRANMERGVVQGDPIAPATFAFSIKDALARTADAGNATGKPGLVDAYLDDGCLVGPPEYVLAAYKAFAEALSACGGELNHGKTIVYAPPERKELADHVAAALAKTPGAEDLTASSTTELLGCHFGPLAKVRQALTKRLNGDLSQAAQRIVRLAHHDTQVALQLARMCFAHKAIYLFRVHTPEEVALFAPAFDELQRKVATACAFRVGNAPLAELKPLAEEHWEQASLPLSMGGLGFVSAQRVAPLAWLGSVAQVWQPVKAVDILAPFLKVKDTGHYLAMIKVALAEAKKTTGLTDLTLTGLLREPSHIQRQLSQKAAARALSALRTKGDTKEQKLRQHRLDSAKMPMSRLVISVNPTREFKMKAEVYTAIIQTRLGILSPRDQPGFQSNGAPAVKCICGYQVKPPRRLDDAHFAECQRCGHRTLPHNEGRDALCHLASKAMMGAVREAPIGGLEGAKPHDRADGRFTEKGLAWLWDLTVVNIRRGKGEKNTQHPLLEGYMDKQKRYKVINSKNGHIKVFPLVIDSVGGCCRRLEGVLERIGLLIEPTLPPGALDWSRPTGAAYAKAYVGMRVLARRHQILLQLRDAARTASGPSQNAKSNLGLAATLA